MNVLPPPRINALQFAKPSHLSLKRLLLVGAALLCSVLSLSAQAQYGGGGDDPCSLELWRLCSSTSA